MDGLSDANQVKYEKCALCGHTDHPTMASVYDRTRGTDWLCHEGDHSCYHLWTVYGMRTLPVEHVRGHVAQYLPLEHPVRQELEKHRVR